MMPEDGIENRLGPPGVNSRSMTSTHSAADLEVLKEIDHVYFSSPTEFDAARYALEKLPSPPTIEAIEEMFTKLKRQQQVVSAKALHLISQRRDECDKEFAEIQKIREELVKTLETCRKARAEIKTATNNLTVSTFVILANYRKRQIIKDVLKSLELLKSLRSVEKDATELVNKKNYKGAIELILKSKKIAAEHQEFTCIAEISTRLQDTLEMTEEKLDMVLSNLCYNFDENVFRELRNAYNLLGKTQTAMEQFHMHYSVAINETSIDSVKSFTNQANCMKFQDLCQAVPTNKAPLCLLNLCDKLFLIMKSYYLLVNWFSKNEDVEPSTSKVIEIENNVNREYVKQKLKAGLAKIWNEVQIKVSVFLKSSGLEEFPFEKFIQMLGILRKLTQIAEVFCGDKSDLLQDFIKTQSIMFIKNYHKGRMDELKLFLENEGWEQCPVKTNFTLLSLQEFKQFKRHITLHTNQDVTVITSKHSQSDGTSSVNSQDESVFITKYFDVKTSRTPFEMFHDENVTNEDIFGLEPNSNTTDDSDDEPEELKRDYVDETEHSEYTSLKNLQNRNKLKESIIVTNTTLSVLKNCGQYLQICRYLPQISLEVVMLMNQLFEYYFYTVHLFFTSDLDVSSSTLYTPKLTAVLKRISNNIDTAGKIGDGDGKSFMCPELPSHLDMSSDDTLHGLIERVVGVESVIFLAKQFEILQPYLESIVAQHQKMILELFKENTLAVAVDLRMPVYMCSASKAVDARSALIAMSQVRWDVKDVAVEHSPYVDMILRKIQVFALRLENITKVSLNLEVTNSIWSMVSKFIVHLLVEGFSNATKCSNGGRGLMQLDYRQLFMKLEKISGLKPIPYQEYVDRYVKAYYLPRNGLEEFIKERHEYSNKHLVALVTCACDNKRDRQELIAIFEGKES